MREQINEILVECTGRTSSEITSDTERDFFLTAQEAVDYGVIDEIVAPSTITENPDSN